VEARAEIADSFPRNSFASGNRRSLAPYFLLLLQRLSAPGRARLLLTCLTWLQPTVWQL